MICSLSNLKSQDLDQIRTMEAEVGQPLLAFSCHDFSPATLSAEKLEKIQALEKKLGVALVAVNS
jgi:hypothetical protein